MFSVEKYMFDRHKEFELQRTYLYSTRNISSLLSPHERLTSAQRSAFFMGCQIRNELHSSTREILSRNTFRRRVKYYLLNK